MVMSERQSGDEHERAGRSTYAGPRHSRPRRSRADSDLASEAKAQQGARGQRVFVTVGVFVSRVVMLLALVLVIEEFERLSRLAAEQLDTAGFERAQLGVGVASVVFAVVAFAARRTLHYRWQGHLVEAVLAAAVLGYPTSQLAGGGPAWVAGALSALGVGTPLLAWSWLQVLAGVWLAGALAGLVWHLDQRGLGADWLAARSRNLSRRRRVRRPRGETPREETPPRQVGPSDQREDPDGGP